MSDELTLLNNKVDNLAGTVVEIKTTVRELTNVISKLIVVEERQTNTIASVERITNQLEKINQRISALEQQNPTNKRISIWIDRAMFTGIGLLIMMVLKRSNLL
jgi:hypothetical protein